MKFLSLDFKRENFLINEKLILKKELHMAENLPTQILHPLDTCHAKLRCYIVYCGLEQLGILSTPSAISFTDLNLKANKA